MDYQNVIKAGLSVAEMYSAFQGALTELAQNYKSATEPNPTFACQWWMDETSGLLKQRNADNTAWIVQGKLDAPYFGLALQDGWTPAETTWSYIDPTHFSAIGDLTGKISKSDKIRLVQTISKYFYVLDASYNSGTNLTTITITGGCDYSLADAPITEAYYSYAANPPGFPHWFNYVPTVTGFSTLPGNTIYRFMIASNQMHIEVRQGADGVSNVNTFTITAPCNTRNITNMLWEAKIKANDNGVPSTTIDSVIITANSNVMTLYKGESSIVWSTTGGKRASFQISFEI